jgi:hypothetical protein
VTRAFIDWDGDGAFAVISRPGQAAEVVRLAHRDAVRLMSEAAGAVLVEEGRRKHTIHHHDHGDAPPHFIGVLGE